MVSSVFLRLQDVKSFVSDEQYHSFVQKNYTELNRAAASPTRVAMHAA